MVTAPPRCAFRRILLALPLALLSGCTDSPTPVEPRIDARPYASVGPVVAVTNTDDNGPGSLRQTIADAAAGTTIQFDASIAGQTIVLTGGAIEIDKVVTIEGPSAGMTISGGLSSGVFVIGTTADVVLRNLSIVNGRSADGGGGVHVLGKVTIDHSLIANNETSTLGGGIFVEGPGGSLTLLNSTVAGNAATTVGGGVQSTGETTVTIRNSTIAENVAGDAGGVWITSGTFSLRNSIIANNIDDDDTNANNANCLIKSGVAAIYAGRNITNEDPCDPTMLVADPQLASLASNGGPTKTYALGASSAAIDAGTSCTETTDQRYVARPQGSTCDVGAFEFNDFGTYTLTIGPNVAVNAKTGVASVTGTLACSKPTILPLLDVSMSQTQKTKGRFTAIIEATGGVGGTVCSPSPTSWSVQLTPASGKFAPGTATGTATTSILLGRFLPATATSTLKVFQVK